MIGKGLKIPKDQVMNLCEQLGLNGHITLFLDYRNNYNIDTHENRILYEHLTNVLHVYKHINTQKSPTFDSNVHFLVLFLRRHTDSCRY
jgi:hypothetical protein